LNENFGSFYFAVISITRDREDNFSTSNANLFKSIFRIYEDSLEIVKPEITKSSEKNQQHAATEIL